MPTFLGLFLWMFVLMMNHFFLVAEKALAKNLGFELTFRLFMVGMPKLLLLAIPMAVLLGTLIALGRISADREWVALQAAGMGPGALLRPVLLHGLLGALLAFFIYAVAVPQTHYAVRNLRGEVIFSSNLAADLRPRIFYSLHDGAVMHVDEIQPGGQRRLENVLLIRPDPERKGLTELIVARYGDLYPAPDRSGAVMVDLFDGQVRYYRTDQPEQYQEVVFDSLWRKRFPPPRFLKTLMTAPDKVAQDFTMGELLEEVRAAEEQKANTIASIRNPTEAHLRIVQRRVILAKIELQRRFAVPFAPLALALLALPLGLTTARSGKGAGFAMSVVVIVLYRLVFVAGTNQSTLGHIPASVGPWIANACTLLWAAVAFWRLRRRSAPGGGGGWPTPLALARRIGARLQGARRKQVAAEVQPSAQDLVGLAGLTGTSRRFVGRLDRYLAMAFLRLFTFAFVATYMIYAVVDGQAMVDQALRSNLPLSVVGEYLLFFAPGVLHIVMPISCLVGAVVSVTLLSRNQELVAIKAAGVSMRRATVPIVLITLLFGVLLFLVQDRIAPSFNQMAQERRDRIERRAPRTHGLPTTGSWRFGSEGTTLYHFQMHDSSTDEYRGLSVFTYDREAARIVDHRYIDRARYVDGKWRVEGGWYRYGTNLTTYDTPEMLELDIPPNLVEERRWLGKSGDSLADQMSLSQLNDQIEVLKNSGYDITKLQVAYHRKFAQALAPLVMVLLGLPFAFSVGRRGSLYGIGVSLLLVLVYWATFAVFNALGLETLLPPPVAAWAPNVLYGLLGIYLLLYVRT